MIRKASLKGTNESFSNLKDIISLEKDSLPHSYLKISLRFLIFHILRSFQCPSKSKLIIWLKYSLKILGPYQADIKCIFIFLNYYILKKSFLSLDPVNVVIRNSKRLSPIIFYRRMYRLIMRKLLDYLLLPGICMIDLRRIELSSRKINLCVNIIGRRNLR